MNRTRMAGAGCVGFLLCALLFSLNPAQTQTKPAANSTGKAPDIGFDYREWIAEHQKLLNSGQGEKAVELLIGRAKFPQVFQTNTEDLKKKFAAIYGAAGKHNHHELYGYRRLSSYIYAFHVLCHYENAVVQFNYVFEKVRGEWKLFQFGMIDNPDLMMQAMPVQMIEDR